LDAAKQCKEKIVVVGKGPEYQHLQKRIENENIKNVILTGYVPDEGVAYLLKKCAFLVLPSQSRGECFGQVLLEAEYFHKPMISTELGTGTSVVNQDGVTGFVVPKADSDALAKRMNDLFGNENLRAQMGEAAYKRYQENYTEAIQGPKYLEIYQSLLAK
jgi:rhamnosyl/mannosyltransferase